MGFESREIPLGEDNSAVVAELQKVVTNTGSVVQNTQGLTDISDTLSSIDSHTDAIETATELIDDAVYADNDNWTEGASKHILVGGVYQATPQTVTDNDTAPIELDVNGKIIESNSASIKTAVELIDDAVYTDGTGTPSKGVLAMGSDGTNPQALVCRADGTQLVELYDTEALKSPEITPIRELKTVNSVRLVGTIFEGTTLDTNFWTATETNGGTVVLSNGAAELETNTTANGAAILQSVRGARFIPSNANQFRGVIQLETGATANNKRRWGAFDGNNGFFFELDNDTLYAVSRVATADTRVETGYSITTNYTRYVITYTNLSAAFYINDDLKVTISVTTAPKTGSMTLPVRLENVNSGDSTTDVAMNCLIATICRLGEAHSLPTSYYFAAGTTAGAVLKRGAGSVHRVLISSVSNNSVVTLYDNVAATGTVLWTSGAMAANTTPFDVEMEIPFYTGLDLVVATANCSVVVVYE